MNPIIATVFMAHYQGTPPMNVMYGSDVPIELTVTDLSQFPANSTAAAYAKGFDTETVYINQRPVSVSGNKITFTPDHGFFVPGDNVLIVKVRPGGETGDGYTFPLTVNCKPNPAWGKLPANPVDIKGYAEVAEASAEQAAAVLEEIKTNYPMVATLSNDVNRLEEGLTQVSESIENIQKGTVVLKLDGEIINDRYRDKYIISSSDVGGSKKYVVDEKYESFDITMRQNNTINIYTFLDANGNVIAYEKATETKDISINVPVPKGAKYLVCSNYSTMVSTINVSVRYSVFDDQAREFIKDVSTNITKNIVLDYNGTTRFVTNPFNLGNLLVDEFVVRGKDINSRGDIGDNAAWDMYDYFVDVSGKTELHSYVFNIINGTYYTISFYDTDGTFQSRVMESSGLKTVAIPSDAKYAKFCVNNTDSHQFYITFGEVPKAYEDGLILKESALPRELRLEKGKSLRFCVFGDLHFGEHGGLYDPNDPSATGTVWDSKGAYAGATKYERAELLIDTIIKEHNKKPFDFILSTGDLVVEGGSTRETFNNPHNLEEFAEKYMHRLPCPLFVTAGNHDCFTEEDWQKFTGLPRQFSFETDDFYFVCLDTFADIEMGSNTSSPSTTTGIGYSGVDFDFLNSEIAKAGNKKIIIVAHCLMDNADSSHGKSDIAKLTTLFNQNKNIFMAIYGHSHKYSYMEDWHGIPRLNSNHFCYPTKQWCDAYNDHNNLWSISIVEINEDGTEFVTRQVQPAHNYVGMGLNYPYTIGTDTVISKVAKNGHAMFKVSTYDKGYFELVKAIDLINKKIDALT